MSYTLPGTANTLMPNMNQPINFGAINFGSSIAPKNTALNNAKSGPSFSIPGVSSGRAAPFSVPNSVTGLMNSTAGGVSTPPVLPQGYTGIGQDLSNLGKNLGIASGYGVGGVPLNPNQPPQQTPSSPPLTTAANWNIPQQPQYSSSGGAIIPQGGPTGTPAPQTPSNVGTPQGANANPPDWYTQALSQQNNPPSTPTPSPTPPPATPSTTPPAPPPSTPNTPAGYAQSLASNAMKGSPIAGAAANGLLSTTNSPLVSGLLSDYQQKAAEAQRFQQSLAQGEQNLTQQAVPLTDVEGEKAAMERNYGIQEQALANQASIAQTALQSGIAEQGAQQTGFNEAGNLGIAGQGQLQSGLTSAGQLTQPSSQFTQVSPGNYLADSSGQGVAGGQQQGLQNLTNLGIAQQNISQGQGFQQQSADLSNTLTSLKNTGQQVVGLMGLSGANWSSSPVANQAIKAYMQQANPLAQQSINAGLGEVKNYVSSILASNTGLTPTDVSAVVNAYPFENLSPNQLAGFLQNIDSMGQTRLQALQQSQSASYGGNAGFVSPASGQPAAPTALSAGQGNNPIQAGVGTGVAAAQGIFSNIFSQLGSVATGAAAEWLMAP